jgi:uncharacterized membrane protein YkoI
LDRAEGSVSSLEVQRTEQSSGSAIMSAKSQSRSIAVISALVGALGAGCAHAANTNNPSYQSSIIVGESGDSEHAEAARYAELAKIDVGKAIAAAQARVPGKVLSAALDNENGNLVYSVVITPASGGPMQDIKVDAGNAAVLHTDTGNNREGDEEERD